MYLPVLTLSLDGFLEGRGGITDLLVLDLDRGHPAVDELLAAEGRENLGQHIPVPDVLVGPGLLRNPQDVELQVVGGLPARAGCGKFFRASLPSMMSLKNPAHTV